MRPELNETPGAGGAGLGRKQLRQIERQPAEEDRRDEPEDEHAGKEQIGFGSQGEVDELSEAERGEADEEVGRPPAEQVRQIAADEAADRRAAGTHDRGEGHRLRTGLADDGVGPGNQPLRRAPAAEDGDRADGDADQRQAEEATHSASLDESMYGAVNSYRA